MAFRRGDIISPGIGGVALEVEDFLAEGVSAAEAAVGGPVGVGRSVAAVQAEAGSRFFIPIAQHAE